MDPRASSPLCHTRRSPRPRACSLGAAARSPAVVPARLAYTQGNWLGSFLCISASMAEANLVRNGRDWPTSKLCTSRCCLDREKWVSTTTVQCSLCPAPPQRPPSNSLLRAAGLALSPTASGAGRTQGTLGPGVACLPWPGVLRQQPGVQPPPVFVPS